MITFNSIEDRNAYLQDLEEWATEMGNSIKEKNLMSKDAIHSYLNYRSLADAARKVREVEGK